MNWRELEDQILERLDVKAEYEKLGVVFTGKIRDNGCAECKAWGRQDDKASAYVNVDTGHYKDSGGGDREITLWQFAADTGRFPNWQTARQYYADKVGVNLGNAKPVQPAEAHCTFCGKPGHWRPDCPDLAEQKKQEGFKPALTFVPDPETENTNGVATLISNWIRLHKKCPVITREGCMKAGAILGTKQYAGRVVDSVIGWESFDEQGIITGAIVVARAAEKIRVKAGDGDDAWSKCQSLGEPGLVGRGGVYHLLRGETAPIILKCEGLSDMLAAYSKMPKVFDINEDTPWPVTNKNGAVEHPRPYMGMMKRARQAWIVHDRDEAGVKGAEKWAQELHAAGVQVKIINLPFPLEAKHGKDLRDYFQTATWGDFMVLCQNTPFYTPAAAAPPPQPPPPGAAQNIPPAGDPLENGLLERCGLHVLGHREDDTIEVYSSYMQRMALIEDIGYLSMNKAIVKFGDIIDQHVKERNDEEDPRPTIASLRKLISLAASRRLLTADNRMGTGVWLSGDEFVLVNGNTAWVMDNKCKLKQLLIPVYQEKTITLREGDEWFNPQELQADLDALNADPTLKHKAVQRVVDIFDMFNFRAKDETHRHKLAQLYVGVMGAMLLQTTWSWRPIITVNGATGCGKTEFLTCTQNILSPKTDEKRDALCKIRQQPSAAGIRQFCMDNSYILFIDEFEKVNKRQEIFDMFRTFSAGSVTLRGTVHHEAKQWHLRIIPLLASIESGVQAVADDNRRISFEILKPKIETGEYFRRLPVDFKPVERLFRAAILVSARKALEYERELRSMPIEIDQRRKDSYACSVAMYAAMMDWPIEKAAELLKELVEWVDSQTDSELKSDEVRLVQVILDRELRESHGQITTLRSIHNKFRQIAYEPTDEEKDMMERKGFRYTTRDHVAIIPSRMKQMLEGTEFSGMQIKEILMRIKGAKYQQTQWYSEEMVKSVLIPRHEWIKLSNPEWITPADQPIPF